MLFKIVHKHNTGLQNMTLIQTFICLLPTYFILPRIHEQVYEWPQNSLVPGFFEVQLFLWLTSYIKNCTKSPVLIKPDFWQPCLTAKLSVIKNCRIEDNCFRILLQSRLRFLLKWSLLQRRLGFLCKMKFTDFINQVVTFPSASKLEKVLRKVHYKYLRKETQAAPKSPNIKQSSVLP
jgi:hypothetical protein